jgi:holliday junction DNA helicase RuvA
VAPPPTAPAAAVEAPPGAWIALLVQPRFARVIASVRGMLVTRLPGEAVVEAAGVGYRLSISSETLAALPRAGEQATLLTHLILRDDGMHLYGFSTQAERELFLMLIGVQGVGPKVALAVLSGGAPRELLNAIATGDTARFQAVPGIGKRTAERIIVELREKVAGRATDDIVVRRTASDDPRTLAREGLLGLGFTPQEADRLLDQSGGDSPEELIQGALRAAR